MSTRIQRWLREEVIRFGKTQKAGPSEALRRVVEEWWALQQFSALEFREGITGRRAGLRGGPDVWEVIMVWLDYAPDRDGFHAHFGGYVTPEDLEQALEYYERLPGEIDARIEENRRLGARLEAKARRA